MSTLSRDAIAAAAIELADAEGLDAVSMRRVATALGVGTMSLYHYVRTKDELLALMGDAIMGEFLIPEAAIAADWRGAIREIALRTKASYDRHPWMLLGMLQGRGGVTPGINLMRHADQSIGAFAGLGLSPRDRLHLTGAVDEYVMGYVSREAAEAIEQEQDAFGPQMAEWFEDLLASGDYPHFNGLFGDRSPTADEMRRFYEEVQAEDRFEPGLDLMLDGIAVFIERVSRR